MKKPQIIVSVYGGVVQDVFCSDEDAEVTVVDWDVQESDPDAPNLVEFATSDSRTARAMVVNEGVESLAALRNTDVAAALNAAGLAPLDC